MGKKRFYDAVRDLIRDVQDPVEEPARTRPRLTIASLLAGPQTCAACWDPVPVDDPVFACNNCLAAYCPSCLEQYGRTALKDRQMLPLRCADQQCRAPVPLSGLRGLLSPDEIARLSRFQCDLLQSPDEAPEVASDTASSDGAPIDDGGQEALESLMGTMGWRRCPDCGTGIERTQGCSHMVCVCGGEFCYSCGERWGVGGFGCPRRCGLPLLHHENMLHEDMLGLLPLRLEAMREEVMARIAVLFVTLDQVMEVPAIEPIEVPPVPPVQPVEVPSIDRPIESVGAIRTRPQLGDRRMRSRPHERHTAERNVRSGRVGIESRPPTLLRGLESAPGRMQTRCMTRVSSLITGNRTGSNGVEASGNESRPAKMRLRSLVHPSRENRL